MKRRNEARILSTVLGVARADERVRAVILTGSRAEDRIPPDDFQDFDVVYLVRQLDSFGEDPDWTDVFGNKIIQQQPETMRLPDYPAEPPDVVTYLMLFTDFNRIDLKLMPVEHRHRWGHGPYRVLLDKDGLTKDLPPAAPFRTDRPTQRVFSDCCNEFWWVSTYVLKGLARGEPLYARAMLEGPVRRMFLLQLSWYVGARTGFAENPGPYLRFVRTRVPPELWRRILLTYPDADTRNSWQSLLLMAELFDEWGRAVAKATNLEYNAAEAGRVRTYLIQRGAAHF